MGTELGAWVRKPLGRELHNNLDKVRSYAFEIPCMRLGAVAVAAAEGALVQRHPQRQAVSGCCFVSPVTD